MEDNENYLPQYDKDKIIQDEINNLLDKMSEFEPEMKRFDPYSLDSTVRPSFLEGRTKFINGIKKLPPASIPLKSASKGKFISEIEIMRTVNNELQLGSLFGEKQYIQIDIPNTTAKYFIRTVAIKKLLGRALRESYFIPYEKGKIFMAIIVLDRQFLIDNCVKLK